LIGLNFYGYDFSKTAEPILGKSFVEILKEKKSEIMWDENAKEHYFHYQDKNNQRHTVYYPSLKSIKERLDFAEKHNLGVAIWELGQGLDYFFDLF
jgi:chitinase domain-containing protein 1